jgi:hypothetical protein
LRITDPRLPDAGVAGAARELRLTNESLRVVLNVAHAPVGHPTGFVLPAVVVAENTDSTRSSAGGGIG